MTCCAYIGCDEVLSPVIVAMSEASEAGTEGSRSGAIEEEAVVDADEPADVEYSRNVTPYARSTAAVVPDASTYWLFTDVTVSPDDRSHDATAVVAEALGANSAAAAEALRKRRYEPLPGVETAVA